MPNRPDPAFQAQLDGFSLTTAEIIYRLPDAPSMLQTFIWQDYDRAPRFPKLQGFLAFWRREIEGPLHSVRVAHAELIRPLEMRVVRETALN